MFIWGMEKVNTKLYFLNNFIISALLKKKDRVKLHAYKMCQNADLCLGESGYDSLMPSAQYLCSPICFSLFYHHKHTIGFSQLFYKYVCFLSLGDQISKKMWINRMSLYSQKRRTFQSSIIPLHQKYIQ